MKQTYTSGIGKKVTHYSPILSFLGNKKIFHFGYDSKVEPLTQKEKKVADMFEGITGDEDTYDACFKAVLNHIKE